MRSFKHILYIVIVLLYFTSCTQEKFEQPNVIILLADDQGYGDLSCHGNPELKTPHLDQLYKESIRFTDFHTSSICTPTRSQLMTGIDAVRNGAYNFGFGKTTIFDSIPDTQGNLTEVHLMSEYFKENGYITGHFGKWHLGDIYPNRSIDRGFDEALTFPSASVWQASNYWNNDGFDDYYYRNGKLEKTEGYCNDLWFNETMNFIDKAKNQERPFFVYLPTSSMHTPLFVPKKYIEPYKHLSDYEAQFFGLIANFDENYGRLDQFLEDQGLKENTIFVYLSDNGGTFGVNLYNAGMQGQKGRPWDGGHRVPCFLRWPKGLPDAGKDINDLVVVQDLLPTLINLCDLKNPWTAKFDGIDITPKIKGEDQDLSKRMSVVQFSTKPCGFSAHAILWNKWRLLGGGKLFNIEKDPAQKSDVADQHPGVVREMQAYYDQWLQSVQPSINKHSQIEVGYEGFKELNLTCFDWINKYADGNPSQQYDIRQGMPMWGYFNINYKSAGKYKFIARRWAKEADAEISAGIEPYFTEFSKQKGNSEVPSREEHHNWGDLSVGGVYPIGEALNIAKAKIIVDGKTIIKPVKKTDKFIEFDLDVESGVRKTQVDFMNKNDEVVCGAYYLDILKL